MVSRRRSLVAIAFNVEALAMLGLQSSFRRNKSTVNEQKDKIMNQSSTENFQPEQKLNNEPQPMAIPSAQVLPMHMLQAAFWERCGISLFNENNLETMARMPDNYIDLTVTSPPYDGLRTYNGYSFDFENVAKELLRVTKKGGVVCWVVNDATVNGSESGTSFRQALYFKEIGFNIHDTMIYKKKNFVPLTHNRYEQSFEYMFIFSKGKPKTFNPLKSLSIYPGLVKDRSKNAKAETDKNYSVRKRDEKCVTNEYKIRPNIFEYAVGIEDEKEVKLHPAIFPEKLAAEQIQSWSNEGDLVYDCFGGSGTTAKMAFLQNRKCILSEISLDYCELSKRRLLPYVQQQRLSFDGCL